MGIYLSPDEADSVRYKITKGDVENFFKAEVEVIGNFAYLRIRTKPELYVALNRELNDEYLLLVKATLRRQGRRNLETRCDIRLKILDVVR